jgi:bifunctional DNA-binding transcriptional regulator/antitoxin component of YhaV-PrlF toxin-antitoxin module
MENKNYTRRILKRNDYSSYITIPKKLMEKMNIKNDDVIEIKICDDILIITKSKGEIHV